MKFLWASGTRYPTVDRQEYLGQMMGEISFRENVDLEILRRLPIPARDRTLEFVISHLRVEGGSAMIHMLDTDFLLVDRVSASTCGQESTRPICCITIDLLEAALYWVTGQDSDIEEMTCRASGGNTCEFKICLGGR